MALKLERGTTIIAATHNPGKARELAALLDGRCEVIAAGELGLPEPPETEVSFIGTAILKARHAAMTAGLTALADDSGLSVAALDGQPGIYSARWAGPQKDFGVAMQRVEDALQAAGATTPEKRRAHFVAVLCLAWPNGAADLYRGEVDGHMIWPPRGANGFGYDPMFVPDGYDKTYGELTADEKHGMSHRARAFAAFAKARLPR
jgi:XTP/dITP diphosphohydrolase